MVHPSYTLGHSRTRDVHRTYPSTSQERMMEEERSLHKGLIVREFEKGMKLEMGGFKLPPDGGHRLNLGAGTMHLNGVIPLDRPDWNAPLLPYGTEEVSAVYAYHFLEHLDFEMLISQLREIERVLMYEGVFN